MALNLNHLQHRVVFFLFLVIYVFAADNVTVDDQNPSIIYSPSGAWSESAPSTLDLGGSHKLTQNPNATASFNFTGIAIYFLSPLWPYTVNTAISLDSGPSILVNLVDTSRPSTDGGPETVQSHVVWNATGLANIQHNLLISVGAGQSYAIVDGLIYTEATNASSSLSPTSTSQDPNIASSTATTTLAPSTQSKSRSVVAIALGSLFGALGLLIILCGVWYLFRRRKRPASEAWTVGTPYTPSTPRNPAMSVIGPNATNKNENWSADQLYNDGYSMTQSNDGMAWHNSQYENVRMPAPPILSQPYYHEGSSSRYAMHQPQMIDRMSNRYEPGYALSTITERSTPQMGESTPLANTPSSFQSELEGYKAQGSEVGYRRQLPSSLGGANRTPSPNMQVYSSLRRKAEEPKRGENRM